MNRSGGVRTGRRYDRHVPIDRDDFERLVLDALEEVPEPFARVLENVAVVVEERSPPGMGGLYGLYQGVPILHGDLPSGMLPPRVTIYMHPLVDHFPHPDALAEQVRITVLHEVGHHMGMSEARLRDLGYG